MASNRYRTSTCISSAAARCRGLPADRRRSVSVLLTVLICACSLGPARAQNHEVAVESGVERDVNQYRWRMGVTANGRQGQWSYGIGNRFFSDAFILLEDRLRFRDENQLRWEVTRPLAPAWTSRSEGRLSFFSQSRVLIQQAYTGAEYRRDDRFWIQPLVGVAVDQRPGARTTSTIGEAPLRSDVGPAVALRAGYSPRLDGPYSLSAVGSGSWHSIHPRQGYTVSVRSSGGGSFDDATLEGRLDYGAARRDVYQSASFLNRGLPTDLMSETVEASSSDTLGIGVAVEAPILPALTLTGGVDGTLMRRFIRTHRAPEETLFFDTDFNRRAVEVSLGLGYQATRRSASVALQVTADSENRRLANRDQLPAGQAAQMVAVLQQADFDRSVVALRSRGQTMLGRRGAFRFESLFSIVRRDTPDNNPDDRDEAYHNALASLSYRWSQHLETELSVFGSYYHTVYLRAVRSAENNVQQSLRLRPTVRWTPSAAARIELRSEIRATYTVDDFSLPGRRPTDQSAREMRYEVDIERDFGDGLRLIGQAGFTDLRLGRLLWDSFAEIPFDTLQTYTGWLRVQAGRQIVSELGIRTFIRTDFSRASNIRYPVPGGSGATSFISRPAREWIRQIGPTAALSTRFGASEIRMTGWLNVQRVFYRLYGSLPPEDEAVIRAAARRGSRMIIPNLSLSVRWALN